ncbi:hypothetical protein TraAM80_07805 [Trypanosoma rangeli]|uniref:DUF4833 domain-containing protein n=1 Tax=Trypanosoma rangeli TaxID=5698 RepID=A0A3R7N4N0_TRYRA|nr:uncharacterized protein TraAM80_07805 [Trypanosoma rangeli]RNF00097.1 hypothetical protein TraAM80_07805 [Trypanosoma rangeli]|eukprot:RNF00097.1 hypothetical protein TraAM80_07805 [Trypanosoma rangeli]
MGHTKDASSIACAVYAQYGDDATSFNRLLRQRVLPRGGRFDHDTQDTFMYIQRSKNRSVVAYAANLLDAGTRGSVPSGAGRCCVMDPANPVHAYFVILEPSIVEERRKKGATSEISELTFIQRKLAYGCSAKPLTSVKSELTKKDIGPWLKCFDAQAVSYVALPGFPLLLLALPPLGDATEQSVEAEDAGSPECAEGMQQRTADTLVVLLGVVGGVLSVVQRAYVCSIEPKHFYQLPTVRYIELFGVSLETGEDTYEKKLK